MIINWHRRLSKLSMLTQRTIRRISSRRNELLDLLCESKHFAGPIFGCLTHTQKNGGFESQFPR